MGISLSLNKWVTFLSKPTSIAPIGVFRIIFGFMMCGSAIRFWSKGWIDSFFLQPTHFFHYYGFSWINPMGEMGMYLVFALLILSSFLVAIGLFYRGASIVYFVLFTYVELIDASYYLNHYYFVSLVAFLMCFLPAHKTFSLDVWRRPNIELYEIPLWMILLLKFQLGAVYVFAGIAKLNADWLFDAMPMSIWLQAESHWPLLGDLFIQKWVAYTASWVACFFDLTIVLFLSISRFRPFAYIVLVVFHVITGMMFPIGMFPWIMILATLIFFSSHFHQIILQAIRSLLPVNSNRSLVHNSLILSSRKKKISGFIFTVFILIQLFLPFRYLFYPGDLLWTEQGYRFSWRVMLMEKAGTAFFYVTDLKTGQKGEVDNNQFLTLTQEKMMASQPDFILQYAQIIKEVVQSKGLENPIINAEVYVTLNGSRSKLLFDPSLNLLDIEDGFKNKNWLYPR